MQSALQRENPVQHLKDFISDLKPIPPRVHSEGSTYLDKQLQHCKMVLVPNDAVQPPLSPRFSGPFEVIKRCDKYFVLKVQTMVQKSQYLSIDLKSSIQPLIHHSMKQSPSNLPLKKRLLQHDDDDSTPERAAKSSDQVRTRYGRVVKTPQRLTM